MSVYRSTLQNSDPFLMTQRQVNEAIAAFFIKNGSSVTFAETGIDVDAIAKVKSIKFYIESRENQALKYAGTDKVFDSSQISIHIAEQIEQIMRFQQQFDHSKRVFFIIGNPDIRRIRDLLSRID
ncbi:hypothetical protein ABE67_14105 [Cytobacillus firmus]|uniref:hypothetical protein n=1 Tax=Cytobacillus firmus TaxID=1399 RepID=UPI0018CF2396|nr:hypothetical protein [Cytobacillus firmus]MBG9450426.1 hypothetical protein [Cytobacillus firmus]